VGGCPSSSCLAGCAAYGEDWTHHQQIRDAVKATGTLLVSFLDPVLDTFMRALPMTSEALEWKATLARCSGRPERQRTLARLVVGC
jgi:hypothetical protein